MFLSPFGKKKKQRMNKAHPYNATTSRLLRHKWVRTTVVLAVPSFCAVALSFLSQEMPFITLRNHEYCFSSFLVTLVISEITRSSNFKNSGSSSGKKTRRSCGQRKQQTCRLKMMKSTPSKQSLH